MRELVDGGLFEGELLRLLGQSAFFCSDFLKKLGERIAQLVCAHVGEFLGGNHHET